MASTLESKLKAELESDVIDVKDLSDGCGEKFEILAVSDKFKDLSSLKRHRLIHTILKSELARTHAITLHTFTFDEYYKTPIGNQLCAVKNADDAVDDPETNITEIKPTESAPALDT